MKQNITPEEAVIELRNIVKGMTGIDPREGRVIQPISKISEGDTARFLNELFTQKKTGD
jgi:hypothetical protein